MATNFNAINIVTNIFFRPDNTVVDNPIQVFAYYPYDQDMEIISVDSSLNEYRTSVSIGPERKTIIYTANTSSGIWNNDDAADTLQYRVRNTQTGEEDTAVITVKRNVQLNENLQGAPLFLTFKEGYYEVIEIDLANFIHSDTFEIISIGSFERKVIQSLRILPEKKTVLEITFRDTNFFLNIAYGQAGETLRRDSIFDKTKIDYNIKVSNGDILQCTLLLSKNSDELVAQLIDIKVPTTIPDTVTINVFDSNPAFHGTLVGDYPTSVDRGSVAPEDNGRSLTYTFNHGSGYWNNVNANDFIPYFISADTGGIKVAGGLIKLERISDPEPPVLWIDPARQLLIWEDTGADTYTIELNLAADFTGGIAFSGTATSPFDFSSYAMDPAIPVYCRVKNNNGNIAWSNTAVINPA